jgi:general secretion pathway protein A
MHGKVHLELGDVNEVLKDLASEAELPLPSRPIPLGGDGEDGGGSESTMMDSQSGVDFDLGRPMTALDEAQAAHLSGKVQALRKESQRDRLDRLERSLSRLERINMQSLRLMQQLVKALQEPPKS